MRKTLQILTLAIGGIYGAGILAAWAMGYNWHEALIWPRTLWLTHANKAAANTPLPSSSILPKDLLSGPRGMGLLPGLLN